MPNLGTVLSLLPSHSGLGRGHSTPVSDGGATGYSPY